MRNGNLVSMNAIGNWQTVDTDKLVDGIDMMDKFTFRDYLGLKSGSNSYYYNEGAGVEVEFSNAKTLKAFRFSKESFVGGTFHVSNYSIDYFNESSQQWESLTTIPSSEINRYDPILFFNNNGAVSAKKWRWSISSFDEYLSPGDMQIYELEAYENVIRTISGEQVLGNAKLLIDPAIYLQLQNVNLN